MVRPDHESDDGAAAEIDEARKMAVDDLSRVISEDFCCSREEFSDDELEEDEVVMQDMYHDDEETVPGRPLQIDPGLDVRPGMVYQVPELPRPDPVVDSRVLQRAERLRLHPDQEEMRLPIARALVTKRQKSKSPKSRMKAGLFGRLFKGV